MKQDTAQQIAARLRRAPIVPLIQADDPAVAVQTAKALHAGGLTVLEVVLRTDSALDCLAAIAAEAKTESSVESSAQSSSFDVIVGAGTVLTPDHAKQAIDKGAQFIVSPGLVEDTVRLSLEREVPIYPGVMTASEVQRAYGLGLEVVKFFPASLAGGVPMLKAFSSVFRKLRFMPTGGVSAKNLHEFLELPAVIACGGSWLTPADAIAAGDYAAITALAREAVQIAQAVRPT